MAQTDWNEALTKPSNMISTMSLMLGTWIIVLSLVNVVGGGAGQAGNKVAWIGFIGIGGDAFVPYEDGFLIDDLLFGVTGLVLFALGLRNKDVSSWIEDNKGMNMINNLITGNSKEIFSNLLVLFGVIFYIIWSIQNNTWVDPGVYSVMISMVAFGVALNINSKVEN